MKLDDTLKTACPNSGTAVRVTDVEGVLVVTAALWGPTSSQDAHTAHVLLVKDLWDVLRVSIQVVCV